MLASLAVPAQAQGQALPPPDDNKAQEEWDALMDAVEAAREEMGLSSESGDSADPENGSDGEDPETSSLSDSAQERDRSYRRLLRTRKRMNRSLPWRRLFRWYRSPQRIIPL